MTAADSPSCYHCGLPVPAASHFRVSILGHPRSMCCHGCQAVAEAIVANGLEDYYQHRTELPNTAEELVPDELRQLVLYDHPDIQKSFVSNEHGNLREASLILEGITCAACIWLNERHLQQLAGVQAVTINYASHRARISWDDAHIKLSQILAEIRKLGYHAHPFSAQQQEAVREQQRRLDFRRLAIAGLSAAQVMMIAVAFYAGPAQGLEPATEQLLRWFSLVMTLPAMTYSAWPFYQAAWRGIVNMRIGMDVPITLGLLTGFIGSVWVTLQGHGIVYFDTLTMLIFFLLSTRYLERNAREKSVEAAENLHKLIPLMATRLDADLQGQLVTLQEINMGDQLLVKPGETIAADGVVVDGESSADEALLTGESRPVAKGIGSYVYAGSINYESPLIIKVSGLGEQTVIAGIARLLDRAQAEKPRLARVADHVAVYFTSILLLAVLVIGIAWWMIAPERCFEIVLAVLVVSCPCALSLAAPAAFAAAGSHLVRRGVLMTRGHALESLAQVTRVVFDKTGTLTVGHPVIMQTIVHAEWSVEQALLVAASLEQASEHPLARSFSAALSGQALLPVTAVVNTPGKGMSGEINHVRYWVGNASLNQAVAMQYSLPESLPAGATVVWLSDMHHILAAFILTDAARPGVPELVQKLAARNIQVAILSGDTASAVQHFAELAGIHDWQAGLSPDGKLQALRELQQRGDVIVMVGDGINDAPVLAGAQVSIAMGNGTQMARASGDIVLLNENLLEIDHAIHTSRFTVSVVRQNFAWALVYNVVALPFAATGLIAPWMAAIGMSISSLIVVVNALRLR
ncbi:cadmium-translocating P-type ATPase [Methylobacillus gramineus]|uniref:heavy metal translocating P-type ATPase n=1 Tax=Methylobacillus gramineus TaxID=755169 RepID=UPI001CFF823D|nr:heavy metal translocating P-type ATPase [Methylobacillus gramineus]MCB5185065.1 cadmium-translocating P-type ATPase [Methylobacillus gramineus]